ncbi:hypothetical protein [Streptomyces sp. NBC_00268]|uniref:hypothetical protein n=1 Tax=Streptomyces sp. NBC_00268 TaxID=2975695 RepID=UPI0022581153|nr:hypothetical protein [Streptomyces sp. NBC_00268]MCX5189846.1 hypothetical protein [Streptomyces sp. NBC_00268]
MADGGLPGGGWFDAGGPLPSVIALLEVREARAREELESWLEVLREAEQCVQDARERVEHAQIAREEVVRVFAEEGLGLTVAAPVNDAPAGPSARGV